jgi:hypothetical protein
VNHPLFHGASGWPDIAPALGFDFDSDRSLDSAFRNDTTLHPNGSWLALDDRAPLTGDPLHELLGAPGLWRGMRGQNATCVRVFDLPPVLRVPTDDDREQGSSGMGLSDASGPAWQELIEWAALTANGSAPSGWTAPSRDEIEHRVTAAQLRVRAGAHAVEGRLICEPRRLALEMPSLTRIPVGLAPVRIEWIRELCHGAQAQWRMVRFGIDNATGYVGTEVDLTGAPASCLPQLLELAQDALVNATAWALPALALASDPWVESRMLDRSPRRAPARVTHPSKRARRERGQRPNQPINQQPSQ